MIVRYRTTTPAPRVRPTDAGSTPPIPAAFLFSEVGIQANGMTLSVMSMLCRQDVDPLGEVKHLSALTRADAVARLSGMIFKANVERSGGCRASALASDLISLLPAFQKSAPVSAKVRAAPASWTGPSEVSRRPAAGPEVRDMGPMGWSTRNMNHARLLVAVTACIILIIIAFVDPHSIVSANEGAPSAGAANTTPPTISHPMRF